MSKEDLSVKPEAHHEPVGHTMSNVEEGVGGHVKAGDDKFEVFKAHADGENYRTNGWVKTFFLMFKILFATGVLSIPAVFAFTGVVPGALLIVFWGCYNTYAAFIQASFRNRHPGIHGLQDMAYVVGGKWYRELVGTLFLVGYVLVVGSGIIAGSSALNALSDHAACTVWFAFVCYVIGTIVCLFPRLDQISLLAGIGCASIYAAVLIVVIAVGVVDRPALAPQEGPFELGYEMFVNSGFIGGMTTCLVIFVSSSGSSSFIPMIAEMKDPKDYKKPIAAAMGLLNVSYLVFAVVVYRYCGTWIAPVALATAGDTIKKISFGVGLPGILIGITVNQHVAAKYLFVRILRGTEHLQKKTFRHWATWFGCALATGTVGFVVGEAVPFFGTLIGLLAAVAYTPMAIIIPMTLWLHDFGAKYRKGTFLQKLIWAGHVFMMIYGFFQVVAGSYSQIQSIINQYDAGVVDKAFSCANNG